MSDDPVATRYAQALFESAKTEDALDQTLEQLSLLGTLVKDEPMLQRLLFNPGIDSEEKVGLFRRTLHGAWSDLVNAFVRMVVIADRAVLLPEIAHALQAAVDVERNMLRVVVRSSHPLPQVVLDRLKKALEHREAQHVILTSEVNPTLLGGFQLFLGNRVIDSSVRQSLHELRERLSSVRVA